MLDPPPARPEDDVTMTFDDLVDEAASDSTARTVGAAAVEAEKEAIKLAAEVAAREEESRREGVRKEVEAKRRAEEYARVERERAQAMVLGSLMTYGPRDQAQTLAGKLGLAPEATLRRLKWMSEREVAGGKLSQRTEYFFAYADKVKAARDAAAQHEYLMTDGVQWKFNTPTRSKGSAWTSPAQWPPLPQPAAWGTSGLKPGTTPAGRKENERREGLRLAEVWRKQASVPQREGEEMQAMFAKFREEMKKDMLEMCEKAQSAKAAAADAAPGDGGASGQVIEKRVVELEAAVAALKATNKELQQRYSDAFYKGKQSECENLKLQQKIEALQKQQRSVPPSTSPFNTPVQWSARFPVSPLVVGGFSADSFVFGGPGAGLGATKLAPRRLTPEDEAKRFLPPEGCAFPFAGYVPVSKVPVAPVVPEGASAIGEAPLAVAASGAQAAAEEKVASEMAAEQRRDVREQRNKAMQKKVDTEAGGPVAGDKEAKEAGTRVRQPDRQPGASGDTPDAKGPRSGEPVPVSPSHWQWKGHAGPAERQAGSSAGNKNSRGIKPTIC